jgi:hypothetical protein
MIEFVQILLNEAVLGSLKSILHIAQILVPMLVAVEIARHYKIIERFSDKIGPLLRILTLPKEAAFPIIAGLGFGIIFGAALIIECAREGHLNKRDLLVTGIFLSINHGIIEDTLILAALGANLFILVGVRFLMAVLFTRLAVPFIDRFTGTKTPVSSEQEL